MASNDIHAALPGEGYEGFLDFLKTSPAPVKVAPALASAASSLTPTPVQSKTVVPSEHVAPALQSPRPARTPKPTKSLSTNRIDNNQNWDDNYVELKAYHAKTGSCTVPFGKDTGRLRSWTERQKKLHSNEELEFDKVTMLNELGFDFTIKAPKKRQAKLSTTSASTSVLPEQARPASSPTSVGDSVTKLFSITPSPEKQPAPSTASSNRPYPDKIAKAPSVRKSKDDDGTWNQHYAELVAFRGKNGHCNVPFGRETGGLRSWTERQKKQKGINRMDADRAAKLKEVGLF